MPHFGLMKLGEVGHFYSELNYFRLMVAFSGKSCDEPPTIIV
jgi:hypothetical protein